MDIMYCAGDSYQAHAVGARPSHIFETAGWRVDEAGSDAEFHVSSFNLFCCTAGKALVS
jgi:hypothetical protein